MRTVGACDVPESVKCQRHPWALTSLDCRGRESKGTVLNGMYLKQCPLASSNHALLGQVNSVTKTCPSLQRQEERESHSKPLSRDRYPCTIATTESKTRNNESTRVTLALNLHTQEVHHQLVLACGPSPGTYSSSVACNL